MENNNAGFVRPVKKTADNPLNSMPELYNAALTEFSYKSFESASLNDIIKNGGLSKGSFYYRFADKMDLYLCVADRISRHKSDYFKQKSAADDIPQDFFEQIRYMVRQGIEFSLQEPRDYAFWRMHLAEGPEVKKALLAAFPNQGRDDFEALIRKAFEAREFRSAFPLGFIKDVLSLFIYNVDTMIRPDMTLDDILRLIDNLTDMLQNGLRNI